MSLGISELKRSVAIVGPTPSFLQWAIWQPCPLRELDEGQLADSTFRQLRAIREASIARFEDRIFEGFCVHPQARSTRPESALGFPIEEITGLFGGNELINHACQNCPANANDDRRDGLWAGCYGWLPVDFRFDLEQLIRGETSRLGADADDFMPNSELIELVQKTVIELRLEDSLQRLFLATNPAWYGLWQSTVLSQEQILVVEDLFSGVIDSAKSLYGEGSQLLLADLARFVAAVAACRTNCLDLHVHLMPPGNSDGLFWTLRPHCGNCGFAFDKKPPKKCPVCGKRGNVQQQTRHKVLGLRPYLQLQSVLGSRQTEEFLLRYESRTV